MLLLGALTGVGAGVLTALTGGTPAHSVLCGLAATGLAVSFFNRVVATDTHPTTGQHDTRPHPAPHAGEHRG